MFATTPMTPPQTGGSSASGHQPAAAVPIPVILGSSSSEDDDEASDSAGDEMDVDDDDAATEKAGDEMDVDDDDADFLGLFEASDDAADEPPVEDALPPVAVVAKGKTKAKAKATAKAKANAKAVAAPAEDAPHEEPEAPMPKSKAKSKANSKAKAKEMASAAVVAEPPSVAAAEGDAPLNKPGEDGLQLVAVPVESNADLAKLAFGQVICNFCKVPVSYKSCRIASKTAQTWRCNKCMSKMTELRRVLGEWPTKEFTRIPEELITRLER